MAETPYGNVPDMNQYKRFQSDEELLASIKSGVVNYANSGYLDPNYLRAPIDIIAKNAVPYEKPLQDYTSEDVAMLGNRYKAIKSASEFAKKTYSGLAEQSGLDIVKPEELDSYTKQAEEDYLKAMRSVLSPNYGVSPTMQIAQGIASSPERLSIATQQLLGIGDQKELERRTEASNQALDTGYAKFGSFLGDMSMAVPVTLATASALPAVTATGALGTALRTLPYAVEGGVFSALQPTAEGESRTANVTAGTILGTAMKPVAYVGGKLFDMFKPQKYVARDTAQMLLEDLPVGEREVAERIIREAPTAPSGVVPEAQLTTPEYMASRNLEAPVFNRMQDYLRGRPEPDTQAMPFLDANRRTAEAVDRRIAGAFEGATPENALAIRNQAIASEGKLIGQARLSKLPVNASGVVRYIDSFIKDNPTLDFTQTLRDYRKTMMKDIPEDVRYREAIALNKGFLDTQSAISSTSEKEAIKSLDQIIKNNEVTIGYKTYNTSTPALKQKAIDSISRSVKAKNEITIGDVTYDTSTPALKNQAIDAISRSLKSKKEVTLGSTYDTSTPELKAKAMGAISRSLSTKTGKDHVRAVYDTIITGQKPYDRIRDLHNMKMNIQKDMLSMTPYEKQIVAPITKKIDRAIANEVKQWGEYMRGYAIQMNRANQAEAGAMVRGAITDYGQSGAPKLNLTSFQTLVKRADENFLKGVGNKRLKFTPEQSQALTEVRNTARALQSVQTIGKDTNSLTTQRMQQAMKLDPNAVPDIGFGVTRTGAWILQRIDRRKLPEVYKLMSDPIYFAEVLKNTPPKSRYLMHSLRSAIIGFNAPILTSNIGTTEQSNDPYASADAEYLQYMNLSPEQIDEYNKARDAMEGSANAGNVYGLPPQQ